ncbi:MAG: alpha/beta hydrolase [Pseudonocardiaceae bacterium]|nr:alpha/beta hydrolase [Pseudonocardiaceae bacterium]
MSAGDGSGAKLAGFVHRYEPAAVSGAPTVLLLHGTGADENDLLPLGRALASDAALLSPRGRVSEHGAPRWFRRYDEGVFDTEDLVRRTHELAEFVTAACEHYRRDPTTVFAAGFSNGANIAASTLLLHPGKLRAALLFAPMLPFSEPDRVDLSGAGVFIAAGRSDPIAPADQADELARQLSDRGANVALNWHPGGHGIDEDVLRAAQSWLRKLRQSIAVDPVP